MEKILINTYFIIFTVFTLTCHEAYAQGNQTYLKISENGHYFLDSHDKPFFWQGDTEWELFRCLRAVDAEALLTERRNQGFNVIQVMATGVFPEWGTSKGMKAWDVLQAWKNCNPLNPEENYFQRVDSIVAIAEKLGIILVMGVYHARDNDAGRITLQNIAQWTGWLAARYRNSENIVYSMYPHADSSSLPIIQSAVRAIENSDGGVHLITMHPDPSPASSSFMHTEGWLSFNTLQTWSTDRKNYDMVRSDYALVPAKPVVNGEARYEEEDGTTPFEVRRAGYWSVLAGGFYSYGHRDNWKSPQTSKSWYASPGAQQMKIMGDFFRSIDWWKIIPDQSIFENPLPGNSAARSSDGNWIIAYATDRNDLIINLDSITTSKTADAWWINPLNGERTQIGSYTTAGNLKLKIPEDWQDALLFIERKP